MVRKFLVGFSLLMAMGAASAANLSDSEFVFPEGNSMVSAIVAVEDSLDVLGNKAVQGSKPDSALLSKLSMIRCNLDAAQEVAEGSTLAEARMNQPMYCQSWVTKQHKARAVSALKSLGSTPAQRQVLTAVATWLNSVRY